VKVLVCGGRRYTNDKRIDGVLGGLHKEAPFTELIEGGSLGADALAAAWARKNRVPTRKFEAQWKKFGASAGPRRNREMLVEGKPDLVIAFPGGTGTADMVSKASAAGVRVIRVTDDTSARKD
jgi:ABC-type Fe3+-hydroxamate transport system substrate-binding protein